MDLRISVQIWSTRYILCMNGTLPNKEKIHVHAMSNVIIAWYDRPVSILPLAEKVSSIYWNWNQLVCCKLLCKITIKKIIRVRLNYHILPTRFACWEISSRLKKIALEPSQTKFSFKCENLWGKVIFGRNPIHVGDYKFHDKVFDF